MIRFCAFVAFSFFLSFQTFSQIELYQDASQKGYVKDGLKVKFWDYYDSDGVLELKFNHSSNRIIYLKPDTSVYSIYNQGNWINRKLDVHPRLIGSMSDFYAAIASNIIYPSEARRKNTQGTVYAIFEIDTLGQATNYTLYNDIGDGCGDMVLNSISSLPSAWIPAVLAGKKYRSKFILPIKFEIEGRRLKNKPNEPEGGKLLSEIRVVGFGGAGPSNSQMNQTVARAFNLNTHNSIESAIAARNVAEILNLSSSNLKEISTDIGYLRQLRVLNVSENQLTYLPSEIRKLRFLSELYLDFNQLTDLPTEISNLIRLEILSISSNAFKTVPEKVFELNKLRGLDLSENPIKFISPEISNLENLEILALENCSLTSLPEEIKSLPKLRELNLKGNSIEPTYINELQNARPDLKILK